MKLPTFFVPGAMKCGTSSVASLIKQHRNVFGAPAKEPRFFSLEYDRGVDTYLDTHYSDWSGEKEVFEANPCNLFLPHVPHRISETIPEPKFVVLLRNPVERAYSHWWMKHTSGKEPLSFRTAIRKNIDRISSGREFTYPKSIRMWKEHWKERRTGNPIGKYRIYVDMGHYDRQIERYMDLFPRERIHVTCLSELKRDPETTVRRIWRFIDVDENHPFEEKAPRAGAVGERARSLWQAMCRIGRTLDLERYMVFGLQERVRRLVQSVFGSEKPEMDGDVRSMLRLHYRPHVERLSSLLNRDFTSRFDL